MYVHCAMSNFHNLQIWVLPKFRLQFTAKRWQIEQTMVLRGTGKSLWVGFDWRTFELPTPYLSPNSLQRGAFSNFPVELMACVRFNETESTSITPNTICLPGVEL